MKSSFSLLELLLTLIISSSIVVYSTIFIKELSLKNQETLNLEISKLELFSTKAFLDKNKDDLSQIQFDGNNLYFKNSLLLKNVKAFTINSNGNIATINITLSNNLKQEWAIKL
ncbi:hypothetical protein [Aliarcobacter vitoriensis]|uniref:Prepilin-type N-terminal cleavage/methylation domain-containing protein n=1 Tax=Aliarcobacter vitoriensis TaxID=2011099 RepID=A0A366MVE5_9BACT|nr:hypothetical protein [Aliarcobacter vitoriensis]RBQ29564.1 hypothetical protein CRU91_02885 [Aliarcobacter vitoriensis]